MKLKKTIRNAEFIVSSMDEDFPEYKIEMIEEKMKRSTVTRWSSENFNHFYWPM